jgi:hypothetical protein
VKLQYRTEGFQNKGKPGAQSRWKWAENAGSGSRMNKPMRTNCQDIETWQDVPPLMQRHLTKAREDKNQKELGEFIVIWFDAHCL